ncbi:MAG: RagB/SusD family nutrient uptake outer membrane protein, partial [Odoribacter sp.]|nr:RagB/SusD family nutrient uptake outer membrane protein [Odoribacter sp.]
AAYLPFWNAFNTIVNSSTQLLAVVEGMNDQLFSAGRKTSMIGEIRFLRGMYLFELLRMFGEYDKLDSQYGMIIRETPPDANDVYKARSTVQQTYDFILDDLDYAIANAPDFISSDYASKMAARALKVKVLFYMGKYNEALTAANAFINEGERQLVAPYSAVFTDFSNSELIYTRGFAGTDEVKYQATRVQAYYNEGKWGPTESFMGLVAGDPREEVILKDGVGQVFGSQKTIRKAANQAGTMPIYFMRYSEIYMIKAECEARTGQGDPLATLNAMRTGHGLATIASADDILSTIYNEWLLEMGFENGHEWYATWRMGVDQLLETNQAVLKKMNTSADPALYKANLPYNRIFPIPSDETNANKLMLQNPGYN